MKKVIIIALCMAAAMLAGCATEDTSPSIVYIDTIQTQTPPEEPTPVLTPVPTVPTETETPATAYITVSDGDTLERDIIPQLMQAFSITEEEAKQVLANADNELIGNAKDFRRMEGIIAPGTYEVNGEDINYWIGRWTDEAEQRYDRIAEGINDKNDLNGSERIIFASVIEGDTNLADSYESVLAAVFLNRLKQGEKFYSCPTVEYALGYQRPYLMKTDIQIDSEYNTYTHKGLPPGPICCFDDESLAASIASSSDKHVYYFFYDYVRKEIMSFTSYEDFGAAADESKALYVSTINSDRFVKMADKREYFK